MAYLIYLRKSRADLEAEARGEGETLTRHQTALLALAARQELTITQIYKEIVSGETIAARPVMQQLLGEVERGDWEGVLVMEVERLARGDTIDQGIVAQSFKLSGTKIITPLKTYDPDNEFDEEYFEFGLFMSRREYKTINRRLQQGRMASVKEGNFLGSIPPYGYTKITLPDKKGYSLTPHPEQAPVVETIFKWYVEGVEEGQETRQIGAAMICTKLNQMGIPAAKGGPWVIATVLGILRNPVYIGKIRWGERAAVKSVENGVVKVSRPRGNPQGILVDGNHPALIDESMWQAAQEILKQNPARPGPWQAETKNPLAGLVVCKCCGRKMVRRPYSKKNLADTLICPLPHCKNVASYLDVVEDKVLRALEGWVITYDIPAVNSKQANKPKLSLTETAISRAEKELAGLKKQILSAHDLLEQGVYSVDTFLERTNHLNTSIEQQQKLIGSMEKELARQASRDKIQQILLPQVKHVLDTYHAAATPEQKNNLLKSVLLKVEYKKEAPSPRKGPYDNFSIILFPKHPAT